MAVSTGSERDFTLGEANADLSADTYRAVVLNSAGKVVRAGAGAVVLGVLQNKPKAGEGCTVRPAGATSKLVVDGDASVSNIAIGDKLKSDAQGRGIKASADGDEVFALALQASTATGDVIEALLVQRQG